MPQRITLQGPDLMTPGETAVALKVVPRTVTRWARNGKLTFERTLGGHRRYHRAAVEALLNGDEAAERAA